MKSKTSPTSPKAKKHSSPDIDQYYQKSLKIIEKPKKARIFNPLWFLVLVVFFGFFAGVLGQLVLLSYGSEIPWLDKLDIFSLTQQSTSFITNSRNGKVLTSDQINDIIEEISPSVVQIYQEQETTDDLDSLYLPEESLGSGFILTDDGYIVTTSQVFGESYDNLVVITDSGKVYKAGRVLGDPATDFIYLKIDAKSLQTVSLANTTEVSYLDEVMLIKYANFNASPVVKKSSVLDPDYKRLSGLDSFIKSSESYQSVILLGENVTSDFNHSIAFTFDNKALGVVEENNGNYSILPFSRILPIMDELLAGKSISRPYLGIHYLDLSLAVNVPTTLSQELNHGALIFSDDDTLRPSIITNSPAQKADLKVKDIIISVNGEELNGRKNLGQLILAKEPGQVITLKIMRDKVIKEIKITLEEKK